MIIINIARKILLLTINLSDINLLYIIDFLGDLYYRRFNKSISISLFLNRRINTFISLYKRIVKI